MNRFLAVPILLAIAGCKGLNEYQSEVPVDADAFRGAFAFQERLENGGSWTIPSERQRVPVDYKSALVIVPDKEKLKKMTARKEDVLPPLTPQDRQRMEDLKNLVEIAKGVDGRSRDVLDTVKAARQKTAGGKALDTQEIARIQDAMRAESAQRKKVIDFLKEWGKTRAALKAIPNTPAYFAELRALTDRFFKATGDPNKDVLLNVEEFSKLIDEETKALLKRAKEDEATLQTKTSVRLRLRAWSKSPGTTKPLPLHIDNYDDIDNGVVTKEERVSFSPSPADLARLQQEFEIVSDAASFINDLRDRHSSIREELKKLVEAIRSEVKALPEELKILEDTLVRDLVNACTQILKSTVVSAEDKKAVARLQKFAEDVRSAVKGWKELRDQISSLHSPMDLIRTWVKLQDELDAVRQVLVSVTTGWSEIEAAVARFEAALKATVEDPALLANVREALKKILEQSLGQVKNDLKTFIDTQAAKYGALAQHLAEFGAAAPNAVMSETVDRLPVDPRVKPLDLDRVQRGTIHIDNTPADRRDTIQVTAEILSQETVLSRENWNFPVERFGLNSAFSTQVIFANRIGDGNLGDPSVRYQAAPAVSWMLHYNVRTEPSGDWGSHFWSFVNPGIGVNAAALRFNPSGVDFGVGGQVTLFNDILVAGYGYNFLADKDRKYFFIGIGLLEALDGVGTLVGFSPKREGAK